MKASTILLSSLLVCISVALFPAQAVPRAAEASGAHYLLAAETLEPWHLGGFYRYQERELDDGMDTFVQNKAAVHLGYDLLSWLSVYGTLGSTRVKIEPLADEDSDAAAEYGAGIWANLLDHDLLGNLTMETRMRLQAIGQISHASFDDVQGDDVAYTEIYSALTLSLVTEVIGNKNYWPDAVGLFAGPVYDTIESDDIDDNGESIGIAIGLDLYITRNITISASYEAFETDGAINAGLNCRF
ncbi:MAG: hypothetical protein PHR35_12570 [Kiritimatiellae bacterium]|nr:hypothetical protein [Kiritimatiellia bacterium]